MCMGVWLWKRELKGHQTVFEEDFAGDKDQNSQGTDFDYFNNLHTENSLDSVSLSPSLHL